MVRGVVMLPEVACAAIRPLASQCPRSDGLRCGRWRQKWILLVHLQVVAPATHTPTGVKCLAWYQPVPYLILSPEVGQNACNLNAYLWTVRLICEGLKNEYLLFYEHIYSGTMMIYNFCPQCRHSVFILI